MVYEARARKQRDRSRFSRILHAKIPHHERVRAGFHWFVRLSVVYCLGGVLALFIARYVCDKCSQNRCVYRRRSGRSGGNTWGLFRCMPSRVGQGCLAAVFVVLRILSATIFRVKVLLGFFQTHTAHCKYETALPLRTRDRLAFTYVLHTVLYLSFTPVLQHLPFSSALQLLAYPSTQSSTCIIDTPIHIRG